MNSSRSLQLTPQDALLLVDVQNDFLPGGSLAVPDGEQIIPVLNRYIALFQQRQLPIFATRDWHPPHHCSFKAQGGVWPVHCVQHSHGAEFAPDLRLPEDTVIISKGNALSLDSYSGFSHTTLTQQLWAQGCRRLFIGGVATDYCVLNTVLDSLKEGFAAILLGDGTGAVNLKPGDGDKAIAQMKEAGAIGVSLQEVSDANRC